MKPLSNQPTKIIKEKNKDLTLKCLLLDDHETFNKMSSVSWFFKRSFKYSTWNMNSPDEEIWEEVTCGTNCGVNLELNDEAVDGIFMCKIFPYQTSHQTVLQIEITKTFQLEIHGKFSSFSFLLSLN
jgi:hypothetical protein